MSVPAGVIEATRKPVPATRFRVGDPVVSPAHGLGQVVALERRDVNGGPRDFYVIHVRDTGIRMVVPIEATGAAGLRPPIDRKTAANLVSVFKERRPAVAGIPWSRRHRRYQQLLHSGSAREVAMVMRDLLRLRSRKELSFGERKLLDAARRMLVKEVALACGENEDAVERRFQRAIGLSPQ
jgi:CarD family transcriptional regulator